MVGIPKLGVVTVTTAGTAVKLFGAGPYPKITYLFVRNPNADAEVYLGDINVEQSTAHGILLTQNDSTVPVLRNDIEIIAPPGILLSAESFYVDSSVNSKTVEFFYLEVQ